LCADFRLEVAADLLDRHTAHAVLQMAAVLPLRAGAAACRTVLIKAAVAQLQEQHGGSVMVDRSVASSSASRGSGSSSSRCTRA
jgi:hypothetical protein